MEWPPARLIAAIVVSFVSALAVLSASVSTAAPVPRGAMQAEWAIGIDGRNGLVVANDHGVFRTLDGGREWADITPKAMDGFYEHIGTVIATSNRIWLELEGASVFDFLPYSFNGGRTWHTVKFAGFLSGLVFTNRNDGWVTVTSMSGKRMRYRSKDGGVNWQRSTSAAKVTAPSSVVGIMIPNRGAVPAGLKILHAVRVPGGQAWAQALDRTHGLSSPTYLLKSRYAGKTWSLVSGP